MHWSWSDNSRRPRYAIAPPCSPVMFIPWATIESTLNNLVCQTSRTSGVLAGSYANQYECSYASLHSLMHAIKAGVYVALHLRAEKL